MQFTYSLKDCKFVKANVSEASNLFFQYAASIQEDVSREYIVVQMDDQDQYDDDPRAKRPTRNFFSYDVDERREVILRHGIQVVDLQQEQQQQQQEHTVFHFLGCSNSQVQRHCYIFRRSPNLQSNEGRLLRVLPNLLQLERKKGIPKRVKYTGLLFSGITPVTLPKDNLIVQEIQSVKDKGYDFTDGPGLISRKLALWVKEQLGIRGDCPSVFQIRYCGLVNRLDDKKAGFVCKGILVVDPRNDETYALQFRSSMLKIDSSHAACASLQYTLGICDYSRPTPGLLGQQMVCLFSASVETNDMMRLQSEHLNCAEKALEDPFSMAWILALDRRRHVWQNFHKLLMLELGGKRQGNVPALYNKCVKAVESNCGRWDSDKIKLPLAASRTLFGAVFPEVLHNVLREGECIVLLEDGPLRLGGLSEQAFVIVSRSPSYYPGDIRVLEVVTLSDNHPINELRNCILFSTQGDRPDPDKMGGGDLDGDKYLVVWHPLLLKYASKLRYIEPALYNDSGGPKDESSLQPSEDWIHYAGQMDNAMLSEVESAFYRLAKQYGVDSPEIADLNGLFANLVDRNPTSLDAFEKLKRSAMGPGEPGQCLWEEMVGRQAECTNKQKLRFHSKDYAKQYACFRRGCATIATNTTHFVEEALKRGDFHFLESLRHADIRQTLAEVRLKESPDSRNLPLEDANVHGKEDFGNEKLQTSQVCKFFCRNTSSFT